MQASTQMRMTVYASMMAALTAAGAYIAIPIGPVPIVLQNFFILLTGLLLGPKWGLASVSVYLLAGFCGLPVFAGGTGGIGRFGGPTGGYLIGYLPAVYIIGVISEKGKNRVFFDLLAVCFGCILIYVCGVTWLKFLTGMPATKALAVGMYPFLLGDVLKIIATVPVTKALRPMMPKG